MGQENSKYSPSFLNSDIWEDEQLLPLIKNLEAENKVSESQIDKAHQASSDIEVAMTLRQYEKGKNEQLKRHDLLKQKLMEEIQCLSNSQDFVDEKEITLQTRVAALKKIHKAIISEQEKIIAKEKKSKKKVEPKQVKSEMPASAKMAIQFATRTIITLLKQSRSPEVMQEVCLIATDILSQSEILSLQDKYQKIPEISQSVALICSLFSDILNKKLDCPNPDIALGPTLGLALAQGDLVSTLTVANFLVQNEKQLESNIQQYASKIKTIQGKVLTSSQELNWNPQSLGPDIVISEENRVVTRTSSSSWGSQPTQQTLEGGEHYVEYFIKRNDSSCLLLGVTKSDFTQWSGKCSGTGVFMLQSDGDLYHNDSRVTNLFSYSQNDKIGLHLNLEEQTCQFYKNGQKQGAQINIGFTSVRPTACFGGSDQFVEITQNPDIPEGIEGNLSRGSQQQQVAEQEEQEVKDPIKVLLNKEEYKENEEGNFKELNSKQMGIFIFANITQSSSNFLQKYNLDEPPVGSPIQTVPVEKLQGFNLCLAQKTWELLESLIQLDEQCNLEILLCSLRILKSHLFSVKLGGFQDQEVELDLQTKYKIYQRIQQLLNSETECIQQEATLLFSHCFEIFTSKPVDQIKFLNEGLTQEKSNQQFVNLFLDRFKNLTFLSPIFQEIQEADYQIEVEKYINILLEKNLNYTQQILNKQAPEQQNLVEHLLTLQRALFNLSYRKNEHIEKILQNYILQLLENLEKCVNQLKQLSQQDECLSEEIIASLKDTFLNKPICEFLCSLDIINMNLKLSGQILKNVFESTNALKQINWDKNPKLEQKETVQIDIVESPHPYDNNANATHTVTYPVEAAKVIFRFDSQCHSERQYDYLRLWTNEEESGEPIKKFEGENWERELELSNVKVLKFRFVSDGSTNYWGYKIDIEANVSMELKKVNWLTVLQNIIAFSLTQICKNLASVQVPQQVINLSNPFIASGVKDESLSIFLEENKCSEELVNISQKYLKSKTLGLSILSKVKSQSESAQPGFQRSISKLAEHTQKHQKKTESDSCSLEDYVNQLNNWNKQSFQYSSQKFIEELLGSDIHNKWLDDLRNKAGIGQQRLKGEIAERAVFAVLLLYTGQYYDAQTYSLSQVLQSFIRLTSKIRTNIQQKRQKILEQDPDNKEDLYQKLSDKIVQKCVLLLNTNYYSVLNAMGYQRATAELQQIQLTSSASTPPVIQHSDQSSEQQKKPSAKEKWKKLRSQVHTMSKLKALVNLSKPIEQRVKVPKEEKTTESKIVQMILEFVNEDDDAKQIAEQIVIRRDIALSRTVGLTFLARILRENQSMLHLVSQAFNDSFFTQKQEGKGSIKYHFLNGLEGIDWSLQQILRRAFFQVYKLLQNEVIEAKDFDFRERNNMVKTIEALSYPFDSLDSNELLESRLSAFCLQLLKWSKGQIQQIKPETQFQIKHVVTGFRVEQCLENQLDANAVILQNQKIEQHESQEEQEDEQLLVLQLDKGQNNLLPISEIIVLDSSQETPENFEKVSENINHAAENEEQYKYLAFKRSEIQESGDYLIKIETDKQEGLQISKTLFFKPIYKKYEQLVEEIE